MKKQLYFEPELYSEPASLRRARTPREVVPSGKVQFDELLIYNGGRQENQNVLPYILSAIDEIRKKNRVFDIPQEELVAVACEALSRCHYRFRPKGRRLTTFAHKAIRGALQDFVEKERNYKRQVGCFPPEAFRNADLEAPDHFEERFSNRLLFRKVIAIIERDLDPRVATVLVRRFLEDVPEYEIAKEMGVSAHTIADWRKQGIEEVRRRFASYRGGLVAEDEN